VSEDRHELTIEKIRAASKALAGMPEPTVAIRAHPMSIDRLRRHPDVAQAVAEANPFLSIRLRRDVTLRPGTFVPMTFDEERAWDNRHPSPTAFDPGDDRSMTREEYEFDRRMTRLARGLGHPGTEEPT